MTTIKFQNSALFAGNRPWADVKLLRSSKPKLSVATHKCIVDTGADYLQLPELAATSIGLSLANTILYSINTAGGTVSMKMLRGAAVDIEGYLVTVDVLLDPTNSVTPLAGRGVLLAAFDIGMKPGEWFWS